jgi:hypothetical protein
MNPGLFSFFRPTVLSLQQIGGLINAENMHLKELWIRSLRQEFYGNRSDH